jgi:hypothetical protein
MNAVTKPLTHRGARLLEAHLESFDPEATQARERLELQLGTELTRKLVFALTPHRPTRCAA